MVLYWHRDVRWMPDERSLSSESGFSIIGAALAEWLFFWCPNGRELQKMQLQHAGSAAKYRNICKSKEREMHERSWNETLARLLRNVKARNVCSWYLRYRFGTQMHRRDERNGHPLSNELRPKNGRSANRMLTWKTIFQFWKIVPVRTLRKQMKLERS